MKQNIKKIPGGIKSFFPILKELRNHGMKYLLIAFFLNNRNVQPMLLPLMAYYFGLPFIIIIPIYILIFAFINAVIIGNIINNYIN